MSDVLVGVSDMNLSVARVSHESSWVIPESFSLSFLSRSRFRRVHEDLVLVRLLQQSAFTSEPCLLLVRTLVVGWALLAHST